MPIADERDELRPSGTPLRNADEIEVMATTELIQRRR
jgi:hypothetical protein